MDKRKERKAARKDAPLPSIKPGRFSASVVEPPLKPRNIFDKYTPKPVREYVTVYIVLRGQEVP